MARPATAVENTAVFQAAVRQSGSASTSAKLRRPTNSVRSPQGVLLQHGLIDRDARGPEEEHRR